MADCVKQCLDCARCNYVTFSRHERECNWAHACDMGQGGLLTDFLFTKFRTRRVRHDDGRPTEESGQLMAWRSGMGRERQRTVHPRLVDVVTWGGPHYDPLLELRMHELSAYVNLFLIVEHAHLSGVSRRFNASQPRFAPFARKMRVANPHPSKQLREFVDLDLQTLAMRTEAMNAWQDAYAAVAQPNDLVLVGDIDEVPRAAPLGALLRNQTVLRELDDGLMFSLQGPTYYYHLGCRSRGEAGGMRVVLLSGEFLAHCGGGVVRDYPGRHQGDDRCLQRQLPGTSWHLRYFMPAAQIHEALCHHPTKGPMIDAQEWWNHDIDPMALCSSPGTIRAAIHGCADLWNRTGERGYGREYEDAAAGSGGGLNKEQGALDRDAQPVVPLPKMILEEQAIKDGPGSLFTKLSSVHELEEAHAKAYAADVLVRANQGERR